MAEKWHLGYFLDRLRGGLRGEPNQKIFRAAIRIRRKDPYAAAADLDLIMDYLNDAIKMRDPNVLKKVSREEIDKNFDDMEKGLGISLVETRKHLIESFESAKEGRWEDARKALRETEKAAKLKLEKRSD